MVGPSYPVLRSWKTRAGPAFDRVLRIADARVLDPLRLLGVEAVVPVPQRLGRAWRLGGSPALRLARTLARELHISIVSALAPGSRGRRQATLRLEGRLANPLRFELTEAASRLAGGSVLLVDDFLTSGRTIRAASLALAGAGVREVHVFCLGVRPYLSPGRELQAGSLDEGA